MYACVVGRWQPLQCELIALITVFVSVSLLSFCFIPVHVSGTVQDLCNFERVSYKLHASSYTIWCMHDVACEAMQVVLCADLNSARSSLPRARG